jgi:hypothetical protein
MLMMMRRRRRRMMIIFMMMMIVLLIMILIMIMIMIMIIHVLFRVFVSDINHAPTFTLLPLAASLSIPENSDLAMSVFTVIGVDQDLIDTLTYVMTSSPGQGMDYFDLHINSKNYSYY